MKNSPAIKRLPLSCAGFCLTLLTLAAVLLTGPLTGRAEPAMEYQVKAAFLLNFLPFVEWPAAAFSDASTPICIGVLGDDPFGPALDKMIEGEIIHNRKVVVKRFRQLDELKTCHLLFISKSERGRINQILGAVKDASTLTVSETDGFAKRGGIINFILEGNKIRFEINPSVARAKGLKISSQLLERGRIIGPEPARE